MIGLVLRLIHWTASAPPGDPLGPVDQDADKVRDEACRVVSHDPAACAVRPTPTPRGTGGSGGPDLSFLSLLIWILLIAGVLALIGLLVRWALQRAGSSKRKHVHDDTDEDIVEDRVVVIDRSREPPG
ncbi:MAG: hypothetical protein WCK21_05560, partial [Actinomycetota bacterium]